MKTVAEHIKSMYLRLRKWITDRNGQDFPVELTLAETAFMLVTICVVIGQAVQNMGSDIWEPMVLRDISEEISTTYGTDVDNKDTDNSLIGDNAEILALYANMRSVNPDFYGWLYIEGTDVDYPVMYTPEDPEKYLHLDFYGAYSVDGLPFIDGRCKVSPQSDNLLIYGHNMKDGSMFASLVHYKDEQYYMEHPVIVLSTPEGENEYDIMAAFYDRVYYEDEDVFKFYNFIDAEGADGYSDAVSEYMDRSLYNTGVSAVYGDKLITLITCTYQVENGRFVVIAKKK